MVHIEELWAAFIACCEELHKIENTARDRIIARANLKAFCDKHNLPIDWTQADDET